MSERNEELTVMTVLCRGWTIECTAVSLGEIKINQTRYECASPYSLTLNTSVSAPASSHNKCFYCFLLPVYG